jgi:hypothetical protein
MCRPAGIGKKTRGYEAQFCDIRALGMPTIAAAGVRDPDTRVKSGVRTYCPLGILIIPIS